MIDLIPILESLGIERLREGPKEIKGLCPQHRQRTGKPDTDPSWSINKTTGAHFCFSCGYTGGLAALYSDLGGEMPEDLDQLVITESAKSAVQAGIKAHAIREGAAPEPAPEPKEQFRTTEDELTMLDPVPNRMLQLRYLTRDAADTYGILWDKRLRSWVLPLRDERGVLQGVQYKQAGVNLTMVEDKSLHLFGLWSMRTQQWAAVVESPLDAVRLWGVGIPAVATLGSQVSDAQVSLMSRYFAFVLLAMDRDEAGDNSMTSMERRFKKFGVPTMRLRYPRVFKDDGKLVKDPGDFADDDELLDAVHRSVGMTRALD